ncbi:MAG: SHD1 domain-containing protein [Planctomycetia bacterium]|nr:SHD1 domain-containing protein [Planctomycetia bacterium]
MRHFVILTLVVLPLLATNLNADEFRKWTSASGKYTTEATLEEICDDGVSVLLKKRNGKTAKVVIEQLCEDDKTYISQKTDDPFAEEDAKPASSSESPSQPESKKPEAARQKPPKPEPPKKQEVEIPVTYPFEVSLGNTLDDVRSHCEIIDEKYDKLSNWRTLTIKPKNEAIEVIEAIFRNESTLGYYRVTFRNPTKELTTRVYEVLKPCFKTPLELQFISTSQGEESAICDLHQSTDGSSSRLYYNNTPVSGELTLSFTERDGDAEVSESFKEVLYPVAKDAILDRLKAPATAVFPPKEDTVYEPRDPGEAFILYISVDAQNSYGALIRSRYAVSVHYKDGVASVIDSKYSVLEVKRGETHSDAFLREITSEINSR